MNGEELREGNRYVCVYVCIFVGSETQGRFVWCG